MSGLDDLNGPEVLPLDAEASESVDLSELLSPEDIQSLLETAE